MQFAKTMDYPNVKRPISSKVLMALLVFYGILGLISGALLMADPTGVGLGFTSDIVEKVRFAVSFRLDCSCSSSME